MLLSQPQLKRFWRDWLAACRAQRWIPDSPHAKTKAEIETERHALLQRAGFQSLTQVDQRAGYTAVLKELAILQDNLSAILRADANPRRVLIHNAHQLAHTLGGEPYILALARDKFSLAPGWKTLDDLTTQQLHQLMITLNARRLSKAKSSTPPDQVHSDPTPDPELVPGPF